MSDWGSTSTLVLGIFAALYIGRRLRWTQASHPLPPGPPGIPWVGNVIGINVHAPWITYAEWARTYGDIIFSRLLGNDVIILNSEQVAKDLLENRSKNYSDRPYYITIKMCGLDFSTPFLPYGDRWRLHRRFFHQTFKSDAVNRFLPCQYRKACHLLRQLLDCPEQLNDHVFEYTAAIVMNSTYDYHPVSRKDEFVDMAANVLSIVAPVARPDITLTIGAFPWLLYLPAWFPGMSFKREMAIAWELMKEYAERPFEYALQKSVSGDVAPSMVRDALREIEEKESLPEASWMNTLKEASATAFLTAAETSNSVLMTFFLMMVINQEAQQRAQAEIDAVVGKSRLPTIDDRQLLPFVDAIFRETLRFNPIVPLSIPHTTMEDDVYKGFHIPKGAMLLANLWAMAHDESRYPNPDAFTPERFINGDGSLKPDDVEHITYGFGRRMCIGRHFANMSLWSVMAQVLAVFKILKPLDEDGLEMQVEARFSTGSSIHPLPFGYKIVPRFPEMGTKKLEELIAASP